jgi:hypothetical protein
MEIEWQSRGSYRKFTAKQKAEIVLAGLRGEVSIKEVCREHEIAETSEDVSRLPVVPFDRSKVGCWEER